MVILFLITYFLTSQEAHADVYKYLSSDGVECYTDTPVNRKASLYMRERREPRRERKTAPPAVTPSSPPAPVACSLGNADRKSGKRALPVSGLITSAVGFRNDPFSGLLRYHNGVDIAVPEGTPVKSIAPGIVTYSGNRNGYGNMVIIDHEDGLVTIYGHNNVNLVATGDRVDTRSPIALSGSTGRSTGPHLHFEAWLDGSNITSDFLEGGQLAGSRSKTYAVARKKDFIRKIVMADGTILLTNLPLTNP